MPNLPKQHFDPRKGINIPQFSQGLPNAGYVAPGSYKGPVLGPLNQLHAINGQPSEDDIILAINKMFGTAPARTVEQRAGIPFLIPPQAPMAPNVPSPEANARAYQLMQGAQVPQELDQATQAQMIMDYLRTQGYLK